MKIVFLLAALSLSACSTTTLMAMHDDGVGDFIAAHYKAVQNDGTPRSIGALRERSGPQALLPLIGWTASGKPFANVISGDWSIETRVIASSPRRHSALPRRAGRLTVRVVTIHRTDLPEYFEFSGRTREGFASITEDIVFLDARRSSDSAMLEEAFQHEVMHLIDRPLYNRLSHAELEARAMIRGLARGGIPDVNRDRLFHAIEKGEADYRQAALRLVEALSLVATGRSDAAALKSAPAGDLRKAAAILEVMLDL